MVNRGSKYPIQCNDCFEIYKSSGSNYMHKKTGACLRRTTKINDNRINITNNDEFKTKDDIDNNSVNISIIGRLVKDISTKITSSLHIDSKIEKNFNIKEQNNGNIYEANTETNEKIKENQQKEKQKAKKEEEEKEEEEEEGEEKQKAKEEEEEEGEEKQKAKEEEEEEEEGEEKQKGKEEKKIREKEEEKKKEEEEEEEDNDGKSNIMKKSFQLGDSFLSLTFYGTWDKPLFDPCEVADILGLSNIRKTIREFLDDQKAKIITSNDKGEMKEQFFLIIKGLHRLIKQSNQSHALQFQDWMYDPWKK